MGGETVRQPVQAASWASQSRLLDRVFSKSPRSWQVPASSQYSPAPYIPVSSAEIPASSARLASSSGAGRVMLVLTSWSIRAVSASSPSTWEKRAAPATASGTKAIWTSWAWATRSALSSVMLVA